MNSVAPIVICFAVPAEVKPLRAWARSRPQVHLLETGMGRRNAQATIEACLSHTHPALVISSGFAGGLNPRLPTGQVIYETDADFPRRERWRWGSAEPARFFCADRIAITAEEKRRLGERTGADAVEMESEPIRICCRSQGVTSATIRVISDTADENLPLDFNRYVGPQGDLDLRRLLLGLAGAPGRLPELIRFQRRLRIAANALALVLKQITGD